MSPDGADVDAAWVDYDSLMPASAAQVSPFGRHVRHWRAIRRMSQLDLAIAAGTTARHLSFIETGRSRPGKDLILRIGDALDLSLPDRNILFTAAGLPPAFPAHDLDSQALEPLGRVLDKVLRRHEPYPAWVVRQPFIFVRANAAADAFFPGLTQLSAGQLIDFWFGPGPFRDTVMNWPEVMQAGLTTLRRAAADTGDSEVTRLLRQAQAHAQDRLATPEVPAGSFPVICPVFEFDGQIVRTISAVMRFDTAVEVTTSQLRIELMFPADEAADAYFLARRS